MDVDRTSVERMVVVAACTSRSDAELKRGALLSDGFRAVLLTDDAGGVHPQLALLGEGALRIVVPDHQADDARALLDELDAGVHALPDTGDHERIPAGPGPAWIGWVVAGLLAVFLAYRFATAVIPGMG